MLTDPIADMLTRIRNGQHAKLAYIELSSSKMKLAILEVLKSEGYIADYEVEESDKPTVAVQLKYVNNKPVISEIKRESKPGRRVYTKIKDLQKFYNGLGIRIISTPQGVMSDHQARRMNLGGELICSVF
ncbi:MAG: 30S ribosomal protein S8 [Alphaproteobacteria bacterium]|nr:30S ribosomal protein S8 [Alphaproteobacteria bacterium]OJV16373.1 MAG: 30S ribosomal protein S8 [Alphaproteobacteria bacterium 33-17]